MKTPHISWNKLIELKSSEKPKQEKSKEIIPRRIINRLLKIKYKGKQLDKLTTLYI